MRRDGRSALEPYTALALFAGTALFYVVGSSLFGRD
jgi:hypothetical protein